MSSIIDSVLYTRDSSEHGECYARVLAAGNKSDMLLLQKAHSRRGEITEITPIKKIGFLRHVMKKTITETKLRKVLDGTITVKEKLLVVVPS